MSKYKFEEKAQMPQGFSCMSKNCGLKKSAADLAVFYSAVPANAAAVFTQNMVPGAPIILGREVIKKGKLQAIVVNSKISNVGTGTEGLRNAQKMAVATAVEFETAIDEILVSSTGVIAKQLNIELIENGLKKSKTLLQKDPIIGAKGIMTTDTYAKAISLKTDEFRLTIVGKGSGMIEPNMATMLVYCFTDAKIDSISLDRMLRNAVNVSFNMLSVDTDTSTSDTCAILANGLAGNVNEETFFDALSAGCVKMTEMMARDGEGATKLLRAVITGAASADDAKIYAKAIINSPLIKTMVFGADPNIGRILMALGKCTNCQFDLEKLSFSINGTKIYEHCEKIDYDEDLVRKLIAGDPVNLEINLGLGECATTAYGCDLTHGYIDENAAYYSS